jgi:multidrug efflux system membrane fusion protein
VEVRQTDADHAAIGKGLNAGETVVTDGVDKLEPGSKVAVRATGGAATAATP